MEALAKQILQKLTVLSQTDKKLKLESLVRTFFNCKSKNNRMLLLGVDNKTIIQELLGCSAARLTLSLKKMQIILSAFSKGVMTV